MEHEDADQRRHHRLHRGKDRGFAGLQARESVGIEIIRQIARHHAGKDAKAEISPAGKHRRDRGRRVPDQRRSDSGKQTGIEIDRIARIAAVERKTGKDAVERITDTGTQPEQQPLKRETPRAAGDPGNETASGKREDQRRDLFRRDLFPKQDQREDHDDRRRGIQKDRGRGEIHEGDRVKIAVGEKQQAANTAAEKAPEITRRDAKLLWVGDQKRDREQDRRKRASDQNRAGRIDSDRSKRAREKAHSTPKRARRKHGQYMFFQIQPTLFPMNKHIIMTCFWLVNRKNL